LLGGWKDICATKPVSLIPRGSLLEQLEDRNFTVNWMNQVHGEKLPLNIKRE